MPTLCSTGTRNKPSRSCSRTARRELSALVIRAADLADAHRPMYHNSRSKVRLRKASVDAFRVGRLGSRVADEVECCRVPIDGCERLEQAENAFAGYPVADAQKGGAPASTQVSGR